MSPVKVIHVINVQNEILLEVCIQRLFTLGLREYGCQIVSWLILDTAENILHV